MALKDTIEEFNEVNKAMAAEHPGSEMPLVAANTEYYVEQMETLGYSEEEIVEFAAWLETQ